MHPDSLRSLLKRTAVDMGPTGFDYFSGAGLIDAKAAVSTFALPKPVIDSLTITDLF